MPSGEVFTGGTAPFLTENMTALHEYNTRGGEALKAKHKGEL